MTEYRWNPLIVVPVSLALVGGCVYAALAGAPLLVLLGALVCGTMGVGCLLLLNCGWAPNRNRL